MHRLRFSIFSFGVAGIIFFSATPQTKAATIAGNTITASSAAILDPSVAPVKFDTRDNTEPSKVIIDSDTPSSPVKTQESSSLILLGTGILSTAAFARRFSA